jgi:hypothetical protein
VGRLAEPKTFHQAATLRHTRSPCTCSNGVFDLVAAHRERESRSICELQATLYARLATQSCSSRRLPRAAEMGGERSFAGAPANGEVAPEADIYARPTELLVMPLTGPMRPRLPSLTPCLSGFHT